MIACAQPFEQPPGWLRRVGSIDNSRRRNKRRIGLLQPVCAIWAAKTVPTPLKMKSSLIRLKWSMRPATLQWPSVLAEKAGAPLPARPLPSCAALGSYPRDLSGRQLVLPGGRNAWHPHHAVDSPISAEALLDDLLSARCPLRWCSSMEVGRGCSVCVQSASLRSPRVECLLRRHRNTDLPTQRLVSRCALFLSRYGVGVSQVP